MENKFAVFKLHPGAQPQSLHRKAIPDFSKSIKDMGEFRLVKLEPTAQNAERLLAVINANREFLGEFLEWVDDYNTTDKTLANIEPVCAHLLS